jgi:hypothetical protein
MLAFEGQAALQRDRNTGLGDRRREAITRTSGQLSGVYPHGVLADLRADWPE